MVQLALAALAATASRHNYQNKLLSIAPFLALNQLNRPQKVASGHGQSPINYELR